MFIARLVIGMGMAGEYGSSDLLGESCIALLRGKTNVLISGFSSKALVVAARRYFNTVVPGLGHSARCFHWHFANYLRSGCGEKTFRKRKTGRNTRVKAPVRTMVDILYRGEHRIINI